MRILDQTFEGEEIRIDFVEFQNCTFKNCTFVYGGYGPIVFVGCNFRQARWQFVDAAANTLNFMKILYHHFGEQGRLTVEQTIETLIRSNDEINER